MTVEGDPWKEALERVAREWLADLSPHGADVGEDAAMMATELIAALDAVPHLDREKVAEAIGERLGAFGSETWLHLADAAIAAMRSGAPPGGSVEALAEDRGFTDEYALLRLPAQTVEPFRRYTTAEEAQEAIAGMQEWKEARRVAAEDEEREAGGGLGKTNEARYVWERGPLGDPDPIKGRSWVVVRRRITPFVAFEPGPPRAASTEAGREQVGAPPRLDLTREEAEALVYGPLVAVHGQMKVDPAKQRARLEAYESAVAKLRAFLTGAPPEETESPVRGPEQPWWAKGSYYSANE